MNDILGTNLENHDVDNESVIGSSQQTAQSNNENLAEGLQPCADDWNFTKSFQFPEKVVAEHNEDTIAPHIFPVSIADSATLFWVFKLSTNARKEI